MPTTRRLSLSLVLLLLPALLACPPVRDNIEDAEGGSYGEAAYFVWRPAAYGQAPLWAMIYVPRDDDHSCEAMLNYDWNDVDQDYARLQLSRAQDEDWEGEYTNSYNGCGSWYDTDRRCFDGFSYDEGQYTVYAAESTLTVDRYGAEEVRGTLTDEDGGRLGFRAENCGEMPYYTWVGDSEGPEDKAPQQPGFEEPGGWQIRIR